ncbi:MAG: ThuA domain-containing protein [Clostridia bacterium]|nr:ThuA domain-containing protein [Clostridia bacterium]
MINVTIWNEFKHERNSKNVRKVYPEGIHKAIGSFLDSDDINITYATLDMESCGLTDEVINNTDVLFWWGHMAHNEVPDEIVTKVHDAVLKGMGLIVLHSGHESKIFKSMLGTACNLRWRDNDRERVWCVNPGHPIAAGIPESFELPQEEMYGEPFGIPNPDDIIFMGWFAGGEVFRSGCTFTRGCGRIFYFQPGHEEYPIYYNENVQKILKNAVKWAAPTRKLDSLACVHAAEKPEK